MGRMNEQDGSRATWFVGATYDGTEDQTPRFVAEGIWENGYQDKYLDLVQSMRRGDRIAIKSSYTRKHGLPFDNQGQVVSVMAIKATGTIAENLNDGRRVRVSWTKTEPVREWYFFTHRGTVWRVTPGDWAADSLISFTFDGAAQDIDTFRNAPEWRQRFGSITREEHRFAWTKFYETVADKLLSFKRDRAPLLAGLREISSRVEGLSYLDQDRYADGRSGFLRDICPFTVMGTFNRGTTTANRKAIAAELARLLLVDEPAPETFEGIPVLNNFKSWFFPREVNRSSDHIPGLWDVFSAAIKLADANDRSDEARSEFTAAFDAANGKPQVGWNLTIGFYWIRPWFFPSLDTNSQRYISKRLQIPIGRHGPRDRCNAADYLAVMDAVEPRFQEGSYPVHSYPELSLEAWRYQEPTGQTVGGDDHSVDDDASEISRQVPPLIAYAAEDIINDGCFLERSEVDRLLERVRTKNNIILQGPPGTGKTWLARRLGFALMGQRDERKIRVVQFHPNLSYEDFVRGWRPMGDGKLSLVDGVFMQTIKAAYQDSSSKFVVVIEEINRGNPAQIFGEMLTLMEAGKHTPSDGVELCYPDVDGSRRSVHIPDNVFVIGTMNIADRSLALMDLALRRRFAFVTLEPKFNDAWSRWVVNECGIASSLVGDIRRRMVKLNDEIEEELGIQFRIGHSYVTPAKHLKGSTEDWFRQVVETEIGPLLEEYWFDKPKRAREAAQQLLEGW